MLTKVFAVVDAQLFQVMTVIRCRGKTLCFFIFSSFSFQDTLRECHPSDEHCLPYLPWVSPIYFVTFVLMAQFVLVNVVVAVLMKHLEESNKVQSLEYYLFGFWLFKCTDTK